MPRRLTHTHTAMILTLEAAFFAVDGYDYVYSFMYTIAARVRTERIMIERVYRTSERVSRRKKMKVESIIHTYLLYAANKCVRITSRRGSERSLESFQTPAIHEKKNESERDSSLRKYKISDDAFSFERTRNFSEDELLTGFSIFKPQRRFVASDNIFTERPVMRRCLSITYGFARGNRYPSYAHPLSIFGPQNIEANVSISPRQKSAT